MLPEKKPFVRSRTLFEYAHLAFDGFAGGFIISALIEFIGRFTGWY